METNFSKRTITPDKAIAFLTKEGIAISLEDAETAVSFLYFLAEIFINEIAEDENS
jgi:hypothetical protein